MTSETTVYVGIDAGGTKTLLAFITQDKNTSSPVQYLEGPGVNLKRDGQDKATQTLKHLITSACEMNGGASRLMVYAGVAGAGREDERRALETQLADALAGISPVKVTIATDAEIALYAAHGQSSGVLVIVGTGSIIMGRTQSGGIVRAGGWGRLIGDEAGGYQIGSAALAAVANAMDGGPETQLVQAIATSFSIDTPDALINFAYAPDTQIQRVAPLVLAAAEANDTVALQVINQQLSLLVDRIVWLFERYPDIAHRIAFIGGLSKNDWYSKSLEQTILTRFPEMVFAKAVVSPADAALQIVRSEE